MINRIFKNTFWVSMAALLVSYVIIVGILYDYFDDQIRAELKMKADYVVCGIRSAGEEYLTSLKREGIADKEPVGTKAHRNRITWMDKEGNVLFDSNADKNKMENHINRDEIQRALKQGEGYTVRYSRTLGEQTIYYAKELEDGSVLRISSAYHTVLSLVMAMLQPTAFLVCVIILLAYFMSKNAAKKIVAPINNMDLLYGEMEEEYEELVPLLRRIRRQNTLIDRQMEELKSQQAKFRALTEYMNEGFLVLDKHGNVLSYNAVVVRLFGAAEGMDYTGQNINSIDWHRVFGETVKEALSGIRCQKKMEFGGRIYHLFASPVVVEDTAGDADIPKEEESSKEQIEGAVVIALDETEKEKREQLRREFTSNVSHELKTPLTSISGVAEMIMNGIVRQEDIAGFARNIYEETGKLITLVNDIIFLSRLDEEAVSDKTETIHLRKIAEQIKKRLKMLCREKRVSLKLVGEDILMRGIPTMIEEALYNLCDNGIKYNKAGGEVVVAFHRKKGEDKQRVIISVEDTGVGIPVEERERIFERFYRVDKSHSGQSKGTGLGLSIVKHVVMLHHGEISVGNRMGGGTVVTMELPVGTEGK